MVHVIVGGGVAGTSCAKTLLNLGHEVILIAPDTLKILKPDTQSTELLKSYKLDTADDEISFLKSVKFGVEIDYSSKFTWIKSTVKSIDAENKTLGVGTGNSISFDKICFCTGAKPKTLTEITIPRYHLRDVDSVLTLKSALDNVKESVAIIGSGGIAFDLVHGLKSAKNSNLKNVYWFYDESKTCEKYFDELALKFLLDDKSRKNQGEEICDGCEVFKRKPRNKPTGGASVGGTNWQPLMFENGENANDIKNGQNNENGSQNYPKLHLMKQPVTNDLLKTHNCELAVVAIGVDEHLPFFESRKVDSNMRLINHENHQIFAAGDCCEIVWPTEEAPQFFQMKLWSQAQLFGQWAAVCMDSHQESVDFVFNTFAHMTEFFGYKVIYLGLYRYSEGDATFHYRVTTGVEYVKLVIVNGRVIGAVLIGDTDMEEVMETLIQNEMNISSIEDDILNPDIDLDHYFD